MDSESLVPGSAEDWLRYAKSDLELARIEKPEGVLLENLCFHAQQAAEKTLKAVLIFLVFRNNAMSARIDIPKEELSSEQRDSQTTYLTSDTGDQL